MEKLPTRWTLDDKDFCVASYCEALESSETHWHNHYLLTLYTEGSGVLNINGVDKVISAGDLVVLSNYDFHRHTIKDGEKLSFYSIKFNYDLHSDDVHEYIQAESFPIYAHLNDEQFGLAKRLALLVCKEHTDIKEHNGARIACRLAIEQMVVMAYKSKLSAGIANLFLEVAAPTQAAELHSTNRRVYQAVCYIQEHFRDPSLMVSDVAESVGYTAHYLSEIFKKIFECPCKLYIQKCRLEFARRLILSGRLTITQICYESGFVDLSYFISAFKRAYGVSPGKYSERQ